MIKALPGLKGGPGKDDLFFFFFAMTFSTVGSLQGEKKILAEEEK